MLASRKPARVPRDLVDMALCAISYERKTGSERTFGRAQCIALRELHSDPFFIPGVRMTSPRALLFLSLSIIDPLSANRAIHRIYLAEPSQSVQTALQSPIQRSTLTAIMAETPWRTLCSVHCRVILVDSIVRTMPVNEEAPSNHAGDHVISESERTGIMIPDRSLVWGDTHAEAGGDTTAVYIARDPNVLDSENSYRFIVVLLPRNSYAKVVYFRLTRRRGKWHVKRVGIREG
jgi:hypothetical protein